MAKEAAEAATAEAALRDMQPAGGQFRVWSCSTRWVTLGDRPAQPSYTRGRHRWRESVPWRVLEAQGGGVETAAGL